jgi:WD40 repeat protein
LRIVTASSDGTARIWNAITGNPIVTFTGHTGNVYSANFSPDGLYVVTASSDNTALIWDAITGRPISILTGHTGLVHAANFSADGLRIVTASFDKTVRFWTQVEIENAGQTKSSSLNKDEIGKLR